MCFEDSVHDGDVLSWDFVNRDVANFVSRVWRIGEEKDVSAVKRWLHRATGRGLRRVMSIKKVDAPKDNNNRRLGVCDQPETFVDHKTRRKDRSKVEGLK